ncbi:hypothetical protein GCM10009547_33670 [Sporichthya brevicatena]|uniref:Phosphodiester glycosidase domain-containing protein n=1 Tax=Sporichthya brevicatena TaxID=171442 RepID=A0ABP3S679_9ACTN
MNGWLRRAGVPALTAVLALTALGPDGAAAPHAPAPPGLAAGQAAPTECRTPTTLVLEAPKQAFELPGGATVRIWQNRLKNKRTKRFVAVTIPAGTLVPRALAARNLTRPDKPANQVAPYPNAVVAINGAVYDTKTGVPRRALIVDGEIRKASSEQSQGLALYSGTRSAAWVLQQLTGEARTPYGSMPLAGINWQDLSTAGVNVYTRAWGPRAHPAGRRTVVVAGGRVTAVLGGKKRPRTRPGPGELHLTAPDGTISAESLKQLVPGDLVSLATDLTGDRPFEAGRPPVGEPDGLIGVSSALVRRGANHAGCGTRDNKLRPRSALAWTANGDLIIAAVSGRGKKGKGTAGASASQWAEYLLHLGAVHAVNLDGGGSTALLVRRSVGGPLERLDRTWGAQRKVADSLAFEVPAS